MVIALQGMIIFSDDLERGKLGEEKVLEWLNDLDCTKLVVNVSEDKWFQQLDIDLLQVKYDGEINKIEVKTDYIASKSGNMVYEVNSCKYTNTDGCFVKTQSDFIFYYIVGTSYLLIFNTLELNEWIEINKDSLRFDNMGDYAQGYIIPIRKVKEIALFKGKI